MPPPPALCWRTWRGLTEADSRCCEAADAMRLSARGYHRVLRVARMLADLDGADKIEALSYRALTDEIRRAA